MEEASCAVCGGDGRIANSFGNTTTCPGCRGSGRRAEGSSMRDVTKTKPSHHKEARGAAAAAASGEPVTAEGAKLVAEIRGHASLGAEAIEKLVRSVVDHEALHGQCTMTFQRKIRKQLRPLAK